MVQLPHSVQSLPQDVYMIMVESFLLNYPLTFTIWAINSASLTTLSPTIPTPFILAIPLRIGSNNSQVKITVSPGTTWFLNLAFSIFKNKVNQFSGSGTGFNTNIPPVCAIASLCNTPGNKGAPGK